VSLQTHILIFLKEFRIKKSQTTIVVFFASKNVAIVSLCLFVSKLTASQENHNVLQELIQLVGHWRKLHFVIVVDVHPVKGVLFAFIGNVKKPP
jgi:hypothetical protein